MAEHKMAQSDPGKKGADVFLPSSSEKMGLNIMTDFLEQNVLGTKTQTDPKEFIEVAVHSDTFHLDEVVGFMLIKYLHNGNVILIRTRDQTKLKQCAIVLDVGQVYDPATNRFDHHQTSCNEVFSDQFSIKLSSAGMVWKHFGKAILKKYMDEYKLAATLTLAVSKETIIDRCYIELYKQFFREIDANDNGQSNIKSEFVNKDIHAFPQYLHLITTVSRLNHSNVVGQAQYEQFLKAVNLSAFIFSVHLNYIIQQVIQEEEARPLIKDAVYSAIYGIAKLPPNVSKVWSKLIREIDKSKSIKFVIYPKDDGSYGFSTIQSTGFINEVDLVNEEVAKKDMNEPADLIFIHKNLFCGSAKTLQAAENVCYLSIQQEQTKKELDVQATRAKTVFIISVFVVVYIIWIMIDYY